MSAFGEPLTLRQVTVPNRVWMSPMCQYSAGGDGVPIDWHLVHYGSRAVGGVGLVMVESTAIGPKHRITGGDLGIWNERQAVAHRRLTQVISRPGAIPGIQLQCAGRKGSSKLPWAKNGKSRFVMDYEGGWEIVAPSAIAFDDFPAPREISIAEIDEIVADYENATRLSSLAGYEVVEIHAGHGYLLHQFLSPLSNKRADLYGGTLQNRMRLPLRVAKAVRAAFPALKPVFVRITATDWAEGGITIDEASTFACELARIGIDLLDVTSGGLGRPSVRPDRIGLNVDFSRALRAASGLFTAPVGGIADLKLITNVLHTGAGDAVMIGKALLRDPYFFLRLSDGVVATHWPKQYDRALPPPAETERTKPVVCS